MKIKVKAKVKAPVGISIYTECIKLDSFLKLSDIASTGGMAKVMIKDGDVRVNGEVCTQRGRKLRPGDRVSAGGRTFLVTQPSETHEY